MRRAFLSVLLVWGSWSGVVWAECRRVLEKPDGSVIVLIPNRAERHPGEAEEAWCARMFALTFALNPQEAALPFHDVDSSAIPPTHANREKWRFDTTSHRIKVDNTLPDPPLTEGQKRQQICKQVQDDATAPGWAKELCKTF